MKLKRILATILLTAGLAHAAPAPYPITINSQSATAPGVTAYRAGQQVYRVTFTDGSTASDITGMTAWMSWSTNRQSASVSTSTVSVVGATTGLVDFTFSPSAMNYAEGRYIYEVGVYTGSTISVYRQGEIIIRGSPYATGADPIAWTTNVNIALLNWIGTLPLVNLTGGTTNYLLTANGTGKAPSYKAPATSGDLTAVEVSGLLSVTSGTGPIPIVGLTTAAVTTVAGTAAQGVSGTNAETLVTNHIADNANPHEVTLQQTINEGSATATNLPSAMTGIIGAAQTYSSGVVVGGDSANITFQSGDAETEPGDVLIRGGDAIAGTGSDVDIRAGASSLGSDGTLTLQDPDGNDVVAISATGAALSKGAWSGNASGLTNIPGAEITGNVPQAAISNAVEAAIASQTTAGESNVVTTAGLVDIATQIGLATSSLQPADTNGWDFVDVADRLPRTPTTLTSAATVYVGNYAFEELTLTNTANLLVTNTVYDSSTLYLTAGTNTWTMTNVTWFGSEPATTTNVISTWPKVGGGRLAVGGGL